MHIPQSRGCKCSSSECPSFYTRRPNKAHPKETWTIFFLKKNFFLETVLFWGSGWPKTHHHATSSYAWSFLSTPKPEECLFSNKSSLLWGGLLKTIQKTKLLLSQCGARHLVVNGMPQYSLYPISLICVFEEETKNAKSHVIPKMAKTMSISEIPRLFWKHLFVSLHYNYCTLIYIYIYIIVKKPIFVLK